MKTQEMVLYKIILTCSRWYFYWMNLDFLEFLDYKLFQVSSHQVQHIVYIYSHLFIEYLNILLGRVCSTSSVLFQYNFLVCPCPLSFSLVCLHSIQIYQTVTSCFVLVHTSYFLSSCLYVNNNNSTLHHPC